MSDTRRCWDCKETKPLEEFKKDANRPLGHSYTCLACGAAAQRRARANQPAEERAEESRAFRAGIRKDKCAICATRIQGTGICLTCQECVEALGGLAGLKRAVRAVRYLSNAES